MTDAPHSSDELIGSSKTDDPYLDWRAVAALLNYAEDRKTFFDALRAQLVPAPDVGEPPRWRRSTILRAKATRVALDPRRQLS